jgi:hypothetical protein
MARKIHSTNHVKQKPTADHVAAARRRLDTACVQVSVVLDGGIRDPNWHETQELENAAIELGRMLRDA